MDTTYYVPIPAICAVLLNTKNYFPNNTPKKFTSIIYLNTAIL